MELLLLNNPETNVAKRMGDVWVPIVFNMTEMELFLEGMVAMYNSATYTIDMEDGPNRLMIQGPFVSSTLNAYDLNISENSTIKPTVGLAAYIQQLIS